MHLATKMASEENENFEKENEDLKEKKPPKHDSGAADLEKITDHVEEAEISAQDIGDAMKSMTDRQAKEAQAKAQKERELAKVKISKEDVDLIVNEMEVSRILAERKLREHKGNVVEALTELVR